ncbi:hypothetical protein GGR92_002464 [Spirosoma lacussanchae]|uniref:hypothetical protein n=1 Tax=Spirosoma lacussanchae TaxID=1884249 RepID=UPI0011089C5B|nr:hypothetical protein [Spirosoma lacussanchae]
MAHVNRLLIIIILVLAQPLAAAAVTSPTSTPCAPPDYRIYHRSIARIHDLIASQQYDQALAAYKNVFTSYDFIFLRDYKVAAQLALYLGRPSEALGFVRKGFAAGMTPRQVRKHAFLKKLIGQPDWKKLKKQYPAQRAIYQQRINPAVRDEVQAMFRKDQWKALGALFTFSSQRQDRYAEKRFAPHSQIQLARLTEILKTHGYPGEKLIGNASWGAVIFSHHNSISQRHALEDTLYPALRPDLLNALVQGQISPYELALIDDWYVAVKSGRQEKRYGYIDDALTEAERNKANEWRDEIGLSRVETINALMDRQQQTGLNFHLPFRQPAKTRIRPDSL